MILFLMTPIFFPFTAMDTLQVIVICWLVCLSVITAITLTLTIYSLKKKNKQKTITRQDTPPRKRRHSIDSCVSRPPIGPPSINAIKRMMEAQSIELHPAYLEMNHILQCLEGSCQTLANYILLSEKGPVTNSVRDRVKQIPKHMTNCYRKNSSALQNFKTKPTRPHSTAETSFSFPPIAFEPI